MIWFSWDKPSHWGQSAYSGREILYVHWSFDLQNDRVMIRSRDLHFILMGIHVVVDLVTNDCKKATHHWLKKELHISFLLFFPQNFILCISHKKRHLHILRFCSDQQLHTQSWATIFFPEVIRSWLSLPVSCNQPPDYAHSLQPAARPWLLMMHIHYGWRLAARTRKINLAHWCCRCTEAGCKNLEKTTGPLMMQMHSSQLQEPRTASSLKTHMHHRQLAARTRRGSKPRWLTCTIEHLEASWDVMLGNHLFM